MTDEEKQESLWRNCENSIRHALEHFSAGASEDDAFHHHKWALLSVAHAAEVYGNLLLCVFNPKHPEGKRGHYPSLDGVREALKSHSRLTGTERYVFEEVLAGVAEQRNPGSTWSDRRGQGAAGATPHRASADWPSHP
jgi:hypothetical protein